jgi:hypothetical protein
MTILAAMGKIAMKSSVRALCESLRVTKFSKLTTQSYRTTAVRSPSAMTYCVRLKPAATLVTSLQSKLPRLAALRALIHKCPSTHRRNLPGAGSAN